MNKKHFGEMLGSLDEAVEIARGHRKPARAYTLTEPDARAIRRALGLTQVEFAALLNVPVTTIQGYEQGRRAPDAPARTLGSGVLGTTTARWIVLYQCGPDPVGWLDSHLSAPSWWQPAGEVCPAAEQASAASPQQFSAHTVQSPAGAARLGQSLHRAPAPDPRATSRREHHGGCPWDSRAKSQSRASSLRLGAA
jgi:putative transcriptional regulator